MLKDILDSKSCFKLVCGAGNEDANEVEKLVFVYAKSGAKLFDLSANEDVILAAIEGLKRTGDDITNYHLSVSVGIKGDPHISKSYIDQSLCIKCGLCMNICTNEAIIYENNQYSVNKTRCIGCKKCYEQCKNGAISYHSVSKPIDQLLEPLSKYNISCYELHAIGKDDKETLNNWNILNSYQSELKSICLDRSKIGSEQLIKRVKNCLKNRDDFSTIIQTDGAPMSGGEDDFKTTLQSVATAEIIEKENLPVYIMLSGGTNSRSAELAKLCGIKINGVAIGSYARSIIRKNIKDENFFYNNNIINMAITRARLLVDRTLLFLGKM